MSAYHDLARPVEKSARLPWRAIGRSLLDNGVWGTAAKTGQRLATQGGRTGQFGGYLAAGAGGMRKVQPLLDAYGMAGMVSPLAGVELPGSSLAFVAGSPIVGGATMIPEAIRSARLAGGKYDDAIKQDATLGAQVAGADWIDSYGKDRRNAYDHRTYGKYLEDNGINTSNVARYLGPGMPQRPGLWRRAGNAFENSMGNVMPEVQRGIYEALQKQSSEDVVKSAWVGAMRNAWRLSRAGGGGLRASFGAAKNVIPANARRIGGHALNIAQLGAAGIGTVAALSSDKPYDEGMVQQEGYDGAQAAIYDHMSKMTPFERTMANLDPSLAAGALESKLPGSQAMWSQRYGGGQAYQPGFVGDLRNAWGSRGKPTYYEYDASGKPVYM